MLLHSFVESAFCLAPLPFLLMALISSTGDLLPLNSQLASLSRTIESGKFDLLDSH